MYRTTSKKLNKFQQMLDFDSISKMSGFVRLENKLTPPYRDF